MSKKLELINGEWVMTGTGTTPSVSVRRRQPQEPHEEEYRSRLYLRSFSFHLEDRPMYPYNVAWRKGVHRMEFSPITILYGGNGSGKSTLLNIISEAIGITRKSIGNSNEYMRSYVAKCSYAIEAGVNMIPRESTFLRSEEILEGIMSSRKDYTERKAALLGNNPGDSTDDGVDTEDPSLVGKLLDNPDELTDSERFFISRSREYGEALAVRDIADTQWSNGEVARRNIEEMILPDRLYLLDEPETSLSPQFQQEIAQQISLFARKLRTQFIIATHSPFFLSMEDGRIYDLDSFPARVCEWQQLKNMQLYFALFNDNREKFTRTE